MRYRLSIILYYRLRPFSRSIAAKLANAVAPPNVRYGGTIDDLAKDLNQLRQDHPDWPIWEELVSGPTTFRDLAEAEYEARRSGLYTDTYGVSWG